VKIAAETGMMCLEAKEHQVLPAVAKARGQAWNGFPLSESPEESNSADVLSLDLSPPEM
jgi:hypothetical protein